MTTRLTIDAGNTRVKWRLRVADACETGAVWTHEWLERGARTDFLGVEPGMLNGAEVRVGSVLGRENDALIRAAFLSQGCDVCFAKVVETDRLIPAYTDSLGVDRWAAMLAARQKCSSAFIIVLAGSAVAVDVVAENGRHLGGRIAPGLAVLYDALGAGTRSVIPSAEKVFDFRRDVPWMLLGQTTQQCVDSGILSMFASFIRASVFDLAGAVEVRDIFLAGGDVAVVREALRSDCVRAGMGCHVYEDVVFDGLDIALG